MTGSEGSELPEADVLEDGDTYAKRGTGIECGHGVYYRLWRFRDDDTPGGAIVGHRGCPNHDDGICEGTVVFDNAPGLQRRPDGPHWQLVSLAPLHLEPSIRTSSGPNGEECLHGYLRGDVWTPC